MTTALIGIAFIAICVVLALVTGVVLLRIADELGLAQ